MCAAAERLKAGGTVILNVGGSIHQVKAAKNIKSSGLAVATE
jgi:hypothetical protein